MPKNKLKIAQLFKEIQYGNKSAFDELFFLYYDRLLAFAKQYTRRRESAEEITSELFVKIWLKRNGLSEVINPEVYLYVSIKNACLNLLRSEKRRNFLFVELPGDLLYEDHSDDNVLGMDDKELLGLLNQAVAALPEQRRIIFTLIKEQQLKSSEVAEILGISIRTVESQLYKAVKTLANSISGYLGYHPQAKKSRKPILSNLLSFF